VCVRAGNLSRNNPASRFASSSRVSQVSLASSRPFNASTNAATAFDVHWSKLWDQIVPYGDSAAPPPRATPDSNK